MESRLKLALIVLIVLLFKGSDRILHYIATIRLYKSKPKIKDTRVPTKEDYAKEISLASNLMTQLLLEKWDFEMERSGVKVFIKPGSDKINTFRGDGRFKKEYSLQELISVIKSPFARKEWDGRYAQGTILETNGNSFLTHSTQKGTFPFAAREFSTIGKVDLQDNHARLVSTSIVHPSIEYDQAKVRGHLYLGGWDISKDSNNLQISYIVQVDVGGSIPHALLKSVQTQSPLCVAAVIKYLDEKGPLPFVIQKTADENQEFQIIKEEFDSNQSYSLVIKNQESNSNSFLIALPSKRFKGAKIHISGHDSCKVVKNNPSYSKWISSATEYLVVVTSKALKQVDLEISPSYQSFTINGTSVSQGNEKSHLSKLSTAPNPEIVSIISPTLESAGKILEKVDSSWDTAVDKVANSINVSRKIAGNNASRLITLAKIFVFH